MTNMDWQPSDPESRAALLHLRDRCDVVRIAVAGGSGAITISAEVGDRGFSHTIPAEHQITSCRTLLPRVVRYMLEELGLTSIRAVCSGFSGQRAEAMCFDEASGVDQSVWQTYQSDPLPPQGPPHEAHWTMRAQTVSRDELAADFPTYEQVQETVHGLLERQNQELARAFGVPRHLQQASEASAISTQILRQLIDSYRLQSMPRSRNPLVRTGLREGESTEDAAVSDALMVEGLPEVDTLTSIEDDDLVERFNEDYASLSAAAEATPDSKPLGKRNPNLPVYRPI